MSYTIVDERELNSEQLDNNLPVTPFLSKMARLNSECSNPALQTNCLLGQKWRCVNENGQWRKQKCKFHVSRHFFGFQIILADLVIFSPELGFGYFGHIRRFGKRSNGYQPKFGPMAILRVFLPIQALFTAIDKIY